MFSNYFSNIVLISQKMEMKLHRTMFTFFRLISFTTFYRFIAFIDMRKLEFKAERLGKHRNYYICDLYMEFLE